MEDENEFGTNQKDLVRRILSKTWPVQYKIVGEDSVDKLYDGVQNGQSLDDLVSSPQGGDNFDLSSAWDIVYQGVGLTVNVIALYKIFKQEHNRDPSQEELSFLVRDSGIPSNYDRSVLRKLDALIKITITVNIGDRTIHTNGGNYNEDIQGDYKENSGITQINHGTMNGGMQAAQGDGNKQQSTIAQAAAEIQALLEKLEKCHPVDTETGKKALATEVIAQIESNPTLAERILGALEVGSIKAFEEFLSHPAEGFVIVALKHWQKHKGN